jgi:hypothetical protein
MPDNQKDLFQTQLAKQSVIGTAVTPTVKLMGVSEVELAANVETSIVEEARASLAPAFDATVDKITGEATIKGDASYEDLAYHLDSMFGEATPGAGPGYVRAYAPPLTAVPTPRLNTITYGSALDTRCLKGAVCNEISIKAESNKRVTVDAKYLGHSVESDALAVLLDRSVNYLHSNQAAIKLDTWAGTMGTTTLVPLAYSLELGLNLGWMLQMGIGSAYPVTHKIGKKIDAGSNQLKMSMELDANSAGYYQSIANPTLPTPFKAKVQITFTLGTQIFQIQFAGFAPEAPKYISDADGIATLDFTLSPMYHSTLTNWLKLSLTNGVTTLA